MADADDLERAADQLSEALLALEDVDLNPLNRDDVRTFLDADEDLEDICLRLRHNQHALQDDDS